MAEHEPARDLAQAASSSGRTSLPPGLFRGPPAEDLCAFVDAGPSPFHAVVEMTRRLESAGFTALDERVGWALSPGDQRYVVRDGGSVVAFRVGAQPPEDVGFRLVGAHTDSPTFRVRPRPHVERAGWSLVGVEPYGGVQFHTWLDRDLTLAGRVAVRAADGTVATRLVHLGGAPLRIPTLAIHLDHDLRKDGYKPNPQQHLVPVWAAEPVAEAALAEVLADAAGIVAADIVGHDLVLAGVEPSRLGGRDEAFVLAPRLDNLACCHSGLAALLAVEGADATQVLVANDHEEVGSRTAEGAAGPFLADVLARIAACAGAPNDPQTLLRALARSVMVSADMAHGVHPGYADRHDPEHRPRLGGGPVVKSNAGQSYASDAATVGWFTACAADAGVTLQHFVSRADLPCGSTIGPLTATRLGIPTVDVGNPQLSMHSIREQGGAADVAPMVAALSAHLAR